MDWITQGEITVRFGLAAITTLLLITAPANTAAQQGPIHCVENSPERRGEEGCTVLAHKPLPRLPNEPLFWHIDRFASLGAAQAAADPASVAAEAHGAAWLMTVEPETSDHHGGKHVTLIGPLPLPVAQSYKMQVMSALFAPGSYTAVHRHSGPEAWYVIAGEQCLETPTRVYKAAAGQGSVVPADIPMRLVATGTTVRRSLVLILHDGAKPPTFPAGAPRLTECTEASATPPNNNAMQRTRRKRASHQH